MCYLYLTAFISSLDQMVVEVLPTVNVIMHGKNISLPKKASYYFVNMYDSKMVNDMTYPYCKLGISLEVRK